MERLTKTVFLDLSGFKAATEEELGAEAERDFISDALRGRILEALKVPIKPLPEAHRHVAVANLA
jgi:hypothetical protein